MRRWRRSPALVLSVGYQGQRTRQFSLRPDQVPEVRRWLRNYQELKAAIEATNSTLICYVPTVHQDHGEKSVIEMRRAQLSFGDGLIRGEIEDLREQWMTHVDKVLEDEEIIATVFGRCPSGTRKAVVVVA